MPPVPSPVVVSEKNLLYRRQFLAGRGVINPLPDWPIFKHRTSGLVIAAHPELTVTAVVADAVELICIGNILDPRNPERSNEAVLEDLCASIHTFDGFERCCFGLGGRWLMIVGIGGQTRMYPDACGTKSAFYVRDPQSGSIHIGSQPNILSENCGIRRDDEMQQAFRGASCQNSWSGTLTPFPGVHQLLPNHYIDVDNGLVRRFWPVTPIEMIGVDRAAQRIGELLSGTISAICARGAASLALTGGYDSRLLFACATRLRDHLDTFVITVPSTPFHDVSIPRKLAKKFNVPFRALKCRSYERAFEALLKRNVADMVWDPGFRLLNTYFELEIGRCIVLGQLAEIGRCFYYADGRHPDIGSATQLAEIAGYGGNQIAVDQIARWMEDVPRDAGISILDLYYWEHRVGNWAGMQQTAIDTVAEAVQAYNCRELLVTTLGTEVTHRMAPHALARRVCEWVEPGVLDVGFNADWRDDVVEWLNRALPWRLRAWWRRSRFARAGISVDDGWL
jgi:hypothetical protein